MEEKVVSSSVATVFNPPSLFELASTKLSKLFFDEEEADYLLAFNCIPRIRQDSFWREFCPSENIESDIGRRVLQKAELLSLDASHRVIDYEDGQPVNWVDQRHHRFLYRIGRKQFSVWFYISRYQVNCTYLHLNANEDESNGGFPVEIYLDFEASA
jgi:hypothetical protein